METIISDTSVTFFLNPFAATEIRLLRAWNLMFSLFATMCFYFKQ